LSARLTHSVCTAARVGTAAAAATTLAQDVAGTGRPQRGRCGRANDVPTSASRVGASGRAVLSAFLLGGQVVHRLPDPQGTRRGLPMSALRRGPFASIRAPRT